MAKKFSKQERHKMGNELNSVKDRAVNAYIGFNVIRYTYKDKADADRHLELGLALGYMDNGAFYGCEFEPRVAKSSYKGEPAFEVQYG